MKLELQRKKTIFIHTLHRLSKLHRNKRRKIRGSDMPDEEMDKLAVALGLSPMPDVHSTRLLRRYLRNLRSKTDQVSFGNLFDNQSRFKVAQKKPEVRQTNNDSLVSFQNFS